MSDVTIDTQAQTPTTEATKPQVQASSLPDDTLKARLDQAKSTGKNELLKELGVTDASQLKAALDAIKAQEEATKTTADKLAELARREQEALTRLGAYQQAVASVWQAESSKLNAEQLAAITAIAGDDPAAQVRALNALRPTWQTQAIQSAPVVPVSTAPAANAPPPTTTTQPNVKAQYEQLKTANPVLAAMFMEQHKREIFST